jgi:pSer/pThr/pTyr-binding forkhead associated (FHA) protein
MAILQIADDGQKTAEFARIRKASFVIGRTEGDLVIPHDSLISGRHAEIFRLDQEGEHR